MNKRQIKKANKKCNYPLIDETNLLTMNEKEREQAYMNYEKYCKSYCHFYHHRDKNKFRKMGFYAFPYVEEFSSNTKNHMGELFKRGRKYSGD